ncbi:uncharacterized protein TrAtP1_009977 [Trichoderma atroviride]|uniref:F-box domain-containing protein n=1 Tax=Hypocrea atroviridis (strain ATCC 20476 / IMI 206040) TaxID=452589 RepID=G9NE76_HYPAI|nr:uncharacterized protein TRIATDRAFT_313935 [Trichoderma atroviride IMI 206040]EHK50982.1 hypothetical protein TRIATDRAFT_313935 [Trichoderma atroviride IMI 206040]UKZ68958.1 hypothetical protein TrAtP1_009977 [Trichoderma atroviride]
MAPICHLPLEITGYIVERLSSKDLLCLRQTCRTLHNATLHTFSQKHFRTRRVMLERRSLEALANIAEHLILGPCIEELEICTNHLLPLDELRIIKPPSRPIREVISKRDHWESGQDEETDGEMEEEDEGENTSGEEADSDDDDHCPHLRRLNETAYCKAFNDQEELIERGGDIEYLTRAMKGLVNCQYIRITDDNRVWGLRRLWKEIGILPQRCLTFKAPKSVELVRRMLYAFFTAVAESNASIECLEVGSGCLVNNANRMSPDMLAKPSSALLDSFRLNTLTTLYLRLDRKSPEHNATSIHWTYDLIQFVNRFPELSELGLEFEYRDEDRDSYDDTPVQLSPDFQYGDHVTYTRFPKLSRLLYIPKLEIVRLGMFDCTSMDLAFFLLRHQRTLRDIHLEGINFVDAKGELGGWPWLVEVIRDSFQITSFVIERCWDENLGDILNREAKHLYQDPENRVLEAIDSEGLDKIIKLLQRRIR